MTLSCGSTALTVRSNRQTQLHPQNLVRVKIAAAVATHNFQLPIDGFDHVGCRKRAADGFWVGEEGQVVLMLLAKLGDEAGIIFGEAITELLKLLVADFQIPGSLDGSPALLKLSGIGFAEMVF